MPLHEELFKNSSIYVDSIEIGVSVGKNRKATYLLFVIYPRLVTTQRATSKHQEEEPYHICP